MLSVQNVTTNSICYSDADVQQHLRRDKATSQKQALQRIEQVLHIAHVPHQGFRTPVDPSAIITHYDAIIHSDRKFGGFWKVYEDTWQENSAAVKVLNSVNLSHCDSVETAYDTFSRL